ncbi:hypothetical protein BKN38_05405 [Helicobacter sp. CLO-3]|uniref:hypothetical protein n=1 Tax=unclassified Helicobacter TaxID=2593540 RepID=UPI0008060138|nr:MULTISPECIES: hypothetical protein [unclassified Helicobacter]OBV29054.1 hypothetical protein BA723_07185 [Helicobacter sp. CLO-3]OHU83328.1 hypothetical protein BKN38_05405 [Helicobacter sp. CLO-3]
MSWRFLKYFLAKHFLVSSLVSLVFGFAYAEPNANTAINPQAHASQNIYQTPQQTMQPTTQQILQQPAQPTLQSQPTSQSQPQPAKKLFSTSRYLSNNAKDWHDINNKLMFVGLEVGYATSSQTPYRAYNTQDVRLAADAGFLGLPKSSDSSGFGFKIRGELGLQRRYHNVRAGIEGYYHPAALSSRDGYQIVSLYAGAGAAIDTKGRDAGGYVDMGVLLLPSFPAFASLGYRADFIPQVGMQHSLMLSLRVSVILAAIFLH